MNPPPSNIGHRSACSQLSGCNRSAGLLAVHSATGTCMCQFFFCFQRAQYCEVLIGRIAGSEPRSRVSKTRYVVRHEVPQGSMTARCLRCMAGCVTAFPSSSFTTMHATCTVTLGSKFVVLREIVYCHIGGPCRKTCCWEIGVSSSSLSFATRLRGQELCWCVIVVISNRECSCREMTLVSHTRQEQHATSL